MHGCSSSLPTSCFYLTTTKQTRSNQEDSMGEYYHLFAKVAKAKETHDRYPILVSNTIRYETERQKLFKDLVENNYIEESEKVVDAPARVLNQDTVYTVGLKWIQGSFQVTRFLPVREAMQLARGDGVRVSYKWENGRPLVLFQKISVAEVAALENEANLNAKQLRANLMQARLQQQSRQGGGAGGSGGDGDGDTDSDDDGDGASGSGGAGAGAGGSGGGAALLDLNLSLGSSSSSSC